MTRNAPAEKVPLLKFVSWPPFAHTCAVSRCRRKAGGFPRPGAGVRAHLKAAAGSLACAAPALTICATSIQNGPTGMCHICVEPLPSDAPTVMSAPVFAFTLSVTLLLDAEA